MSATQEPIPDLAQRKLAAEIDKLQAEARLLKRPWLDPRGVLIPFLGAVIGLGSWYQANVTNRETAARATELDSKAKDLAQQNKDLTAQTDKLTQERDKLLEERNKLLLITDQQRAQLATTGAGEQSFAAAVQKVDTIRSNLQAIGEGGDRKQLPTLYVQVANDAQRREWLELRDVAKELGYVVPGIEVVGARAPGRTEVRYFHKTDQSVAEQLVDSLKSRKGTTAVARYVPGYEGRTKPTTLELWVAG